VKYVDLFEERKRERYLITEIFIEKFKHQLNQATKSGKREKRTEKERGRERGRGRGRGRGGGKEEEGTPTVKIFPNISRICAKFQKKKFTNFKLRRDASPHRLCLWCEFRG
jgi:hypothetical protein